MRRKHGLMEEAFTIIVAAGAFAVSPIETMLQSMFELKGRVQIVVLAGKSESLVTRRNKLATTCTREDLKVKVVGFTTDMDELMTASDMLLGKPGGLTFSESLAKGLVLAIHRPIPGQEERNADHLLEEGVAIRCNNEPTIGYKIAQLIADPARFAGMRERALKMGRPHAAEQIARRLEEMLR
jgi:processive 1,2-diacylglycerol beta-glucosyltransferase